MVRKRIVTIEDNLYSRLIIYIANGINTPKKITDYRRCNKDIKRNKKKKSYSLNKDLLSTYQHLRNLIDSGYIKTDGKRKTKNKIYYVNWIKINQEFIGLLKFYNTQIRNVSIKRQIKELAEKIYESASEKDINYAHNYFKNLEENIYLIKLFQNMFGYVYKENLVSNYNLYKIFIYIIKNPTSLLEKDIDSNKSLKKGRIIYLPSKIGKYHDKDKEFKAFSNLFSLCNHYKELIDFDLSYTFNKSLFNILEEKKLI